MEIDSSTRSSPRNSVIDRKVTSGPSTAVTSSHDSTTPTPGTSTTVRVSSGVHSSHARRAGSRVSNTSMPPGCSAALIPRNVAAQSSSVRKTWATLAVMKAASTLGEAGSWHHREASRRLRRRAWCAPHRATLGRALPPSRVHLVGRACSANVPVPQPTSSTVRASSSSTRSTYTSRSSSIRIERIVDRASRGSSKIVFGTRRF